MKELITALIKAQGEFPPVTKDSQNPHFKNNYASLEQVIAITGPALRSNGLALVQTFGVDMTLTTTLWHTSGESISGTQPLLMSKTDAQGLASSSTYARRYGALSILGIAATDDDAESDVKGGLTTAQQIEICNLLETAPDEATLKKLYIDCITKCKAIGDTASEMMFVKAKDKRKAELSK